MVLRITKKEDLSLEEMLMLGKKIKVWLDKDTHSYGDEYDFVVGWHTTYAGDVNKMKVIISCHINRSNVQDYTLQVAVGGVGVGSYTGKEDSLARLYNSAHYSYYRNEDTAKNKKEREELKQKGLKEQVCKKRERRKQNALSYVRSIMN